MNSPARPDDAASPDEASTQASTLVEAPGARGGVLRDLKLRLYHARRSACRAVVKGGVWMWTAACVRWYEEVLVLGDSHANVFRRRELRRGLPRYFLNCRVVGGATVSGLSNPRSKTQAMPVFRAALEQSRARTVVVLIGEVDTGFVIWYRAQKHGLSVEEMLDRALEQYQHFVGEIQSGGRRVICVSAPLPTIADGPAEGEVARLREGIEASQRERTALTRRFNERMSAWCEAEGAGYVMLDDLSAGEDGLVDPRLMNADAGDHHYDWARYAELILPRLRRALDETPAASI